MCLVTKGYLPPRPILINPSVHASQARTSFNVGTASVETYLPPASDQKFGYIYDTKY